MRPEKEIGIYARKRKKLLFAQRKLSALRNWHSTRAARGSFAAGQSKSARGAPACTRLLRRVRPAFARPWRAISGSSHLAQRCQSRHNPLLSSCKQLPPCSTIRHQPLRKETPDSASPPRLLPWAWQPRCLPCFRQKRARPRVTGISRRSFSASSKALRATSIRARFCRRSTRSSANSPMHRSMCTACLRSRSPTRSSACARTSSSCRQRISAKFSKRSGRTR